MDKLRRFWDALSRKALYAAAWAATEAARAVFPEVPLPAPDVTLAVLVALLAGHTLTDIVATFGAALVTTSQQKHGRPPNGTRRRP